MSLLDLKTHLITPRLFGAGRARAIMPNRIFFKLLFSTLAVALSVHMWRQR